MIRKVYVAGASTERNLRAKPMMAALLDLGYEITHDWTKAVDRHWGRYSEITTEQYRKIADDDLLGVLQCDILVLLAPRQPSTGAWVEFGLAIGLQKTIFVAGNRDNCIFLHTGGFKLFATDLDLVSSLPDIRISR